MSNDTKTPSRDAALAQELRRHHAGMVAELDRLSQEFAAAAGSAPDGPRTALATWIEDVLVPHAEEEERTSYGAAGELPEGRMLIAAMLAEHVLIRRLVGLFTTTENPVVAATYGRAVFEVFDSHQRKENDIILPLLVADESVSLTDVMAAAHGHSHHSTPHL